MNGQVSIVLLVAFVGLASATAFYDVPSVEEAAKTLFEGDENTGSLYVHHVAKPVEQVAKELANLKEAAHQEQNNQYDGLIEKYMSMAQVSKDKCSHEALLKINRPFDETQPWEESSLRGYRQHYAAEQFKLCKDEFKAKLTQAVNSISGDVKKHLENIKYATNSYTANLSPQEKAARPDVSNEDLSSAIVFYMQNLNKEKFVSDVKSKPAEQLAEEAFDSFTKAVDSVNESVGSAPYVYFEVAHIPEAVSAFDDFELQNVADLRLVSDLADSLHYESAAGYIKEKATEIFEENKGTL